MRTKSAALALASIALIAAAPYVPRVDALGDPLPDGAIARLGTARFRCEGSGRSVLSPDGKLIVVGGRDGVQLLDASTGKLVRRRTDSILSFTGKARFSPDSKVLAVWQLHDTHVALLDVASCKVVRRLESPRAEALVSFSAKGGLVALGGRDHAKKVSVLLYDAGGKKLKTFDVGQYSACPLLSPDGKALATWAWGGRDGSVQLWDVAKGEKTHKLSLDGSCAGAAFSPDGKRLAVLIPRKDGSWLILFNAQNGKELARATTRRGTKLVAYSPDGKVLATGAETGVQLWDPADCRRVAQCDSPSGARLRSLAFPGGKRVLALGECGEALRLWDVPSGRERTPTGGPVFFVGTLAFSRDGRTLLTGGLDGVRYWATGEWKEVRRFEARYERYERPYYLLSPEGRYVLCGGDRKGGQVVAVASGKEVAEVGAYSRDARFFGSAGAFSADGGFWIRLETSHTEKRRAAVQVWDLEAKRRRALQLDAPEGLPLIAASPGAKAIAVISHSMRREDSTRLGLYDLADGKLIFAKQLSDEGTASAVFSPDGGTVVVYGHELVMLDALTGETIHRREDEKDRYCSTAAFSPDGRILAVSYLHVDQKRGEVLLWELASGKVRARYTGHRALSLAFSPDGKLLATGGEDTTVLLWDVTGRTRYAGVELKDAESLWADLDDDAAKAHRAMARLTASPKAAVALLGKHLKPAPGKPLGEKEGKRLIDQLGDESFDVREKASEALKKAGRAVRPALLARRSDPDLEIRRRVNDLLTAMARSGADRATLRSLRAVEVLERLGTPDARRQLADLAKGNPDARLTRDAAVSLVRLRAR